MKSLNIKLLLVLFITNAHFLTAQIIGGRAYLIGDYINIAIDGKTGKEGTQMGADFHFRGGVDDVPCGLVADVDSTDWDPIMFHGDYYSAGHPENGFGIKMNGTNYNNNYDVFRIDSTALIVYSDDDDCINATWRGAVEGLEIAVNYQLMRDAHYYKTSVQLINTTDEDLVDLYYYRSTDPDNNQVIGGSFDTDNTIVAQPDSVCQKAIVSATQDLPFPSYLGFGAVGDKFRVSMGGFFNRDAEEIWNGEGPIFESGVDSVRVEMDEAISLAYKTDLMSGDSISFSYIIALTEEAMNTGIGDLFSLNYSTDEGENGIAWNECASDHTVKVCHGLPITLFVDGQNTEDFDWQWSPPIGLSDEFGDTTQASPSETTTYTVRHEGDDCLPTIARQIAYEPTEVITTISEDRTIVLGTTTTLEATGGDEYVWYPPDGLSDPFYGVTNARPTETTEYSVLISSHGLFCEDDTRSVTVFVEDEDLSVLANNKFENITIYPNPASDFITVDFGQVVIGNHSVIIHNANGQAVYLKENVSGENILIKLDGLSKGTYVLSFRNEDNKTLYHSKFLIE